MQLSGQNMIVQIDELLFQHHTSERLECMTCRQHHSVGTWSWLPMSCHSAADDPVSGGAWLDLSQ